MSLSLKPDYVFDDYRSVTPELLRALGVRLLLADLDYTLAPKRQKDPDQALYAWLKTLREGGVSLEIISNNRSSERVVRFCSDLGVGYVGHAGKPGKYGFFAAMKKHGAVPAQTAMLGDKLLTDTLGAKRSGVWMLMVEPKGGPAGAWNHVLHVLQEPFKRLCAHDERAARRGAPGRASAP